MRIKSKYTTFAALDVGHTQRGSSLAIFALDQETEVLARDLNGLLARPRVFVAKPRNLRQKPDIASTCVGRYIHASRPDIRHCEIKRETVDPGIKTIRDGARGRHIVGVRNVEQQAIRENAGGARYDQMTGGQFFLVDREFAETPRAESQRLQPEV